MKTFKLAALLVLSIVLAASCSKAKSGSIVLQGSIQGDPGEVIIVSFVSGHAKDYLYPEVNDGKFEFTMDDIEGFADFVVSVGGAEFGARVNALDTLRMAFVVNGEQDVEVFYDGATEKESRMLKDFYEIYNHLAVYNLPSVNPDITVEENIALLDKNDAEFREKYKSYLDKYMTHRIDLAYGLMKTILLDQKAYRDGENSYDWPEYRAILESVDPNDPEEVTFPLVYRWAIFHQSEFGDEPVAGALGFLEKYGNKISNTTVKSMLAKNMLSSCLREIDADKMEVYEKLFAEVGEFIPDNPETVEYYRNLCYATIASRPGNSVPEATFETPDGNQVLLSSLFGKVLYIDVWATWCDPCLKESPFFKSLAEKYKDDERICFISLSIDNEKDKDKWVEFVGEEKSFWPQFILADTGEKDFCDKVGINTIPRFLLVGADGRFINADCARPSAKDIDDILEKAMGTGKN